MRCVYVSSPDVDDAAGGFLVDFLVVDLVLVADALVAVVLVVFLLAAVVRLRGVAAATVVAVAGSGAGVGSALLALSTAAGLAPLPVVSLVAAAVVGCSASSLSPLPARGWL